jgi:hypothetical protein
LRQTMAEAGKASRINRYMSIAATADGELNRTPTTSPSSDIH